MMIKSTRIIPAFYLIVALGAVATVSSCDSRSPSAGPPLEKIIAADQERMRNGIKWNQDSTAIWAKDHLVPAFKRTLDLLSAKPTPRFTEPTLLLPAFAARPGKAILFLFWLEEGFQATGVVVEDEQGVLAKKHIIFWSEKERNQLRHTLIREVQYLTIVAENNPTSRPTTIPVDALELPQGAFARKLRIRLLYGDGRQTEPVEAFVDPALNRPESR